MEFIHFKDPSHYSLSLFVLTSIILFLSKNVFKSVFLYIDTTAKAYWLVSLFMTALCGNTH